MTISRAAERRIRAHAAMTPHLEVCGLLFGREDAIERAEPADNVSASPADSFELDPRALFAALKAERAGGPRLLGHYHSHPGGPAEPSARDAAMALDVGRLWLIVAGDTLALWRVDRPGGFVPVELALASASGNRQ